MVPPASVRAADKSAARRIWISTATEKVSFVLFASSLEINTFVLKGEFLGFWAVDHQSLRLCVVSTIFRCCGCLFTDQEADQESRPWEIFRPRKFLLVLWTSISPVFDLWRPLCARGNSITIIGG